MAEALLDEADVVGAELLLARSGMRAEDADARAAANEELPLIGVRVPVLFLRANSHCRSRRPSKYDEALGVNPFRIGVEQTNFAARSK